jgi:hypothetical protein
MRKVLVTVTLVVLAVFIGTQIVAANAAIVTFRQLFGGPLPDWALGIFVDSNHIYVVGPTYSFGPNIPNLFLSIFRLDNTHKCSVAVDLGMGIGDDGVRVVAYGGNVYVVGTTEYGTTPSPNVPENILLVKFDTNCNVLRAAVYDIDVRDVPYGLSISPDGSTLYIAGYTAGRSSSGAILLAIKTSDFSVAWAKLFNFTNPTPEDRDTAYSLAFSSNKLYVTGRTSTGDLFVSRFDAATGNHELSKVFSTTQPEEGVDLVVAGDKVYVAGNYNDPIKRRDLLFMRLDTDLNLELAKTFGTSETDEFSSLSMVGGFAYAVGDTGYFGTWNAALFAIDPSTGELSHAFVLMNGTYGRDSASTGTCLIFAGGSDIEGRWPTFYGVLDTVTAGTISFTISSPSPSITSLSVTPVFPTPTAERFTPTFNKPSGWGDVLYSWFCLNVMVVSTTTTSTVLTTSTLTLSTTTTKTEATTLTHSTTYSTTTTLSTTTTITQSTTTTLITTTTSTQYFAEPITTYVVPVLLVVIAALLGASLVMGRRRKSSPG